MDHQRLIAELEQLGALIKKGHIVLENGRHTNTYVRPDAFEGMNANDKDGLLYIISHDISERVSNDNIKCVIGEGTLANNVALNLKVPCKVFDQVQENYIMVLETVSRETVLQANTKIAHKNGCIMLASVINFNDVHIGMVSAKTFYSIINLPEPKIFTKEKCTMCEVNKPIQLNFSEGKDEPTVRGRKSGSSISTAGGNTVGAGTPGSDYDRDGEAPVHEGQLIHNGTDAVNGNDESENLGSVAGIGGGEAIIGLESERASSSEGKPGGDGKAGGEPKTPGDLTGGDLTGGKTSIGGLTFEDSEE